MEGYSQAESKGKIRKLIGKVKGGQISGNGEG